MFPYLPVPQHLVRVKEPLLLELTSGVQQALGEMSGAGGSVKSPVGSVGGPAESVGGPGESVGGPVGDHILGLEDRQGLPLVHPSGSSSAHTPVKPIIYYINLISKRFLFILILKAIRYGPLRRLSYSSCGGLWPLAEVFFAL